jgi:lambda family phage tail tape measure protein
MASNQVNINLSLQDQSNSIKQRTNDVKGLNKELQKAQQYTTGTKSGSKAAAASFSAGENIEYGRARGSMGSTGASGRDFANQAQGLGGLVRLYATYAANVFAVSAAFSALSNAMNTSTMVRGLDQLGAASGIAMGGLAKQFAAASEGAISLREAMEATAKATSSGLTKKQFMELGVVAKGASQALGVNMSDAVSRLTRGITKLEPELLDELGIFTKVGKATEEYARSVNKSVDALTDFEKRQAFANAVLLEGRQKFGEIAQESNPYDKLLASLKNVAQEILSVINVGVAPVAKFLAENTALIGVAIAATAVKISQQALPALTSWREGLKLAAADAKKRAEEINTSFGEAFVERAQQRAKVPQIQAKLAEAEQEFKMAKRQFVELDNIYKGPNDTLRALQKDRLLNERELSNIKSDITKKTNQNTEASLKHAQSLVSVQLAQQKILDLKRQESAANDLVQAQADKRSKFGSQEWQREQIVINERAKAAKLALISSVGTGVEERGVGAIGGFYKDVAASKDLSNLQKLKTAGIGTFVGLSTAAGIFSRSLMGAFAYIEVAIIAFGLLSMSFSKNGKELDTFKSGMDNLAEATKTANNVAEKFGATLSTDSINAKANAFGNLTEGVVATVNQLRSVDSVASSWDRFIDGFKVIWGGDIRSRFSVGFVDSIAAAIKTAPEGAIKYELEKKLGALLKTKDLGIEGIGRALAEVPTDKLADLARNVSVVLEESDKILKNAQNVTQNVKETGKGAAEAFLSFSNSVFGSTPLQTFLLATTKNFVAINEALKDSTGAAAEFANIVSGVTKLEFLPAESIGQLQKVSQEYNTINNGLKGQITNLDRVRDRISEIAKMRSSATFNTLGTSRTASLINEQKALEASLPKLQADVVQVEQVLKQKAKEAGEVMGLAIGKQLDLVFAQTKTRLEQLNVGFQQQVSALNPVKTAEGIKEQARLAIRAIDLDIQLRKSNENLITSIDLLRVQMEVTAAQEAVEAAKLDGNRGAVQNREFAEQRLERLQNKQKAMQSGDLTALKQYAGDDPAAVQSLMRQSNLILLTEEQNNKKKLEVLKRDIALTDLQFDLAKQAYENAQAQAKANLDLKKQAPGFLGGDPEAVAAVKAAEVELAKFLDPITKALDSLGTQREETIANIVGKFSTNKALKEDIAGTLAQRRERQSTLSETKGAAVVGSAEYNSMLAQAAKFDAEIARSEEIKMMFAKANYDIGTDSISVAREELNLLTSRGALTEQQSAASNLALTTQQAELDLTQKLKEIEKERFLAQLEYSRKVLEAGGEETDEMLRQYNMIQSTAAISGAKAERDYQAKLKTANITASLVDRQSQYEQVFKNSFQSMTDAIVEFTKTGKLNFKSLIDGMIEGILRVELKMQTESLWATLRPSIMRSLFGGSSTIMNPMDPRIGVNAKGNVYDTGLQAFAKGGMFTNSVVSSPTLFKFAQGTGLMGEAGPEAIMPLKRDSNGNLGVRAGGNGGNVDVVVNNFGSEKATTRETTDSRGNRKIEVIIGDMVASEVSRVGSPVQQSISSNFNNKPALVRR